MSGSAASLPLAALGSNPTTTPLESLQQWNEAQKSGLQAQGLGLQNQQAALMLGLRGQLVGSLGLGPNGQPMAPGQMPPGGGIGGGGAGDPLAGSGMPQVSPNAVMTPFGVPAPRGLMIGAVMSADPAKQMTEIYNMGRQRVTQLMTQAGDVNDPDPAKQAQAAASVRANAGQLYAEGWIDPRAYQTLMSDPAKASAFIRGTASPDAHMSQATSLGLKGLRVDNNGQVIYDPNAAAGLATSGAQAAGAEAAAKVGPALQEAAGKRAIELGTTITTIPRVSPDGRTYTEEPATEQQKLDIIRGGAKPGVTAPGATPTGANAGSLFPGASASPYVNYTNGYEGGSNPNAANPRSTARGLGQFTEGTWLDTFRRVAPDVAAGKSDAEILAYRTNPAWSNVMTQALGDQNAQDLQKQNIPGTIAPNGQPYNGAVAMAHSLGAGGVQKVLAANADTPMTTVFPPNGDKPNPVIAANPSYAKMTAGDFTRQYVGGFGSTPFQPPNATAPATTAPTAPADGGGASIAAPPKPTSAGGLAADVGKQQVEKDASLVEQNQTGVMKAQSAIPVLLEARANAPNTASGSFGDVRASVNNFMATFGPEWVQKLEKATTGLDTSKVPAQQEFIKQAFQLVTAAEAQPNTRVGAMLTSFYAKAMPNINMQGAAIKDMLNFMLVGSQMVRDYGQQSSTFYNGSRDAFLADPYHTQYQPITKFDQTWGATGSANAPQVYEGATLLLNNKPMDRAFAGLTNEQKQSAVAVALRADPTFRYHPDLAKP